LCPLGLALDIRGRISALPPLVASGVPPDVEGGILPPGRKAWTFLRLVASSANAVCRNILSAGQDARLTAGQRPAATGAVPRCAPLQNTINLVLTIKRALVQFSPVSQIAENMFCHGQRHSDWSTSECLFDRLYEAAKEHTS